MKKIVAMVLSVVLLLALACPAMAADFVPSITYKPGLQIVDVDSNMVINGGSNGENGVGGLFEDCVVVTSIAQAKDKSTDISQEDRDLLLEVYEALSNGEMTLPLDGDYVIRDLVDLSFEYDDCRCIEEHGHKDKELAKDGVTLTVTFDMNVGAKDEVIVMAYVNGKWTAIESVVNNGDGTVTCVFEDICPVAFVVKEAQEDKDDKEDKPAVELPKTGDAMGRSLWVWVTVMVVCAAGIVGMLVAKRKKRA